MPALTIGLLHRFGAQADEPQGCIEIESTTGHCGGERTHRKAGNRIRKDSFGSEDAYVGNSRDENAQLHRHRRIQSDGAVHRTRIEAQDPLRFVESRLHRRVLGQLVQIVRSLRALAWKKDDRTH
jgi:hypothetical protein